MIPELRKHLGAIAEDNRRESEWMTDERFDELVELCGIVSSHAVSACEAAWRRDRELAGTHLRHTRAALVLALRTFNLGTGTRDKTPGAAIVASPVLGAPK